MQRIGVVSFLNSRPLIAGLADRTELELIYDVPSALPGRLETGTVDVALIPIVDVLRSAGRVRVLSDACIGCDGETMTVRVFSQTPPDRIRTLYVDGDSHTSVALATVLWRELYDRSLSIRTIAARPQQLSELESVLLIGDKVVDPQRSGFAYEVDLGGAWRAHTGLPFVFAVWAARISDFGFVISDSGSEISDSGSEISDSGSEISDFGSGIPDSGEPALRTNPQSAIRTPQSLAALLSTARDAGVSAAEQIARRDGPALGWSAESAVRYLTRCLTFTLDARHVEGANLFGRLCAKYDVAPADAGIEWPEVLAEQQAAARCADRRISGELEPFRTADPTCGPRTVRTADPTR